MTEMYFRFKRLCLLLRRLRSLLARNQGDPKRTLGAAFAGKIWLKSDTFFWSIFIAFLKVLGRVHAMTSTRPPQRMSCWADAIGYRRCAYGMSVSLNVGHGVWMKLWSASTKIVHFLGGVINVDWHFCGSKCLAVSGLKRIFPGDLTWSSTD